MTGTEERDGLRELANDRFGPWSEIWDDVLRTHPEYVRSAVGLAEATAGNALDPKTRAFVRLSLNAAVTHLREDAVRSAIREARAAGATGEEIFEVILVSCTIGVHGMNAELLTEVLAERGERHGPAELTAAQHSIRDEYRRTRGYWRDFLDPTLELAPDFLSAYLDFSGAPWREGVLEPKVREFIYLAFDTSPTHLHMAGLRVHIHNALDHGASVEEIVDVMAMAAGLGLQTLALAVPILAEEAINLTDSR